MTKLLIKTMNILAFIPNPPTLTRILDIGNNLLVFNGS